ncbi:Relaxase/Mobilisation nuclease domain [Actinobaculum suis]|uniref:Relaxase/Mobilisation nuclease domain n=1 Tax=Actinobaculum suis TaxID=1657 RepID=A0A7Z8Y7W6_9ACTO|nr:relaxase/mobilization nuclease domain-containing protein [Actinobaculum suis]VDG75791.1 Relaxase/Mobilisation nuclease domain [Actinobaculum suis]
MAIIKVLQVKKTLGFSIDYICNPDKTNGGIMVSSNCAAPQFPRDIVRAFEQTVARAERQRRSGGSPTLILAHHIIQSFKPGEIDDPNLAHDLGVQLIEKITGGEHDYVVATGPTPGKWTWGWCLCCKVKCS